MYVHLFSRGEDFLREKINVDDACKLIELQETMDEESDNFIGFTHPRSEDAVIQFIRVKKDEWLLDIPMIDDDSYSGSLVTKVSHSLTLIIVFEFYNNTPFQKAILDKNYDGLQETCRKRWEIAFDTIVE